MNTTEKKRASSKHPVNTTNSKPSMNPSPLRTIHAPETVNMPQTSPTVYTYAKKKEAPKGRMGAVKATSSMVQLKFSSNEPTTIYKYSYTVSREEDGVIKDVNLKLDESKALLAILKSSCFDSYFHGVLGSDMKSLLYSTASIGKVVFKVGNTIVDEIQISFDKHNSYKVLVSPAETIVCGDNDNGFIQALSSFFISESYEKSLVTFGNRIYDGNTFSLSVPLYGRFGISYCFRRTEEGMMLVLDRAASAFITPKNLLKAAKDIAGNNCSAAMVINSKSLEDVNAAFRNIKVVCSYYGYERCFTIKRIVPDSAKTKLFDLEEDGEKQKISVKNYFSERYDIELEYPDAPLMESTKGLFFPMELMSIKKDQRFGSLLPPLVNADMIKEAASKPADMKKAIMESKEKMRSYSFLPRIDVSIDSSLETVTGYQLPAPMMKTGNSTTRVENGAYKIMRFEESHYGMKALAVWMDPSKDAFCGTKFLNMMKKELPIFGKEPIPMIQSRIFKLEQDLRNAIAKTSVKYDLIFVFKAGKDAKEYHEVKRITDTMLKIPSQCVVTSKIMDLKMPYIFNIIQKINAKLGGTNAVIMNPLPNTLKNVMICGADVTHPMLCEKPVSIAAIVASYDSMFTKYAAETGIQERGKEIILDMTTMMTNHFSMYYNKNHCVPQSVIFFRDGVGDSMFDIVLREEIPKIYNAFHRAFPLYEKPLKLTFIICQKRHNVRFFPEGNNGDGNGNMRPGFCVDSKIVSRDLTEFYLQSQQVIQGTGRSCRYTVLVDDNEMSLGTLETFTYSSCHLFNRCSRSISICAPARYAHHLAFRARDILGISEGSSEPAAEDSYKKMATFSFDDCMKGKMFYI